MAVSALDAESALIVIDLQKGILSRAPADLVASVVARASALADAFRQKGWPVVLVTVAGTAPGRTEQKRPQVNPPADWTELVPELGQGPDDIKVTKRTWGAFTGTGLAETLKRLGVTQVVIAGVATSIGVESTARQAHELGFNVTLAVDAMADLSPEQHASSIRGIFPRLGESGTTDEIIALIEGVPA